MPALPYDNLRYVDRVWETTNTIGTGTYTLLGAKTGYRTFENAAQLAATQEYVYCATNGVSYEIGVGTYDRGTNTLARTKILHSSNDNVVVNWSIGIKDVFITWDGDTAAGAYDYVRQLNGFEDRSDSYISVSDGVVRRFEVFATNPLNAYFFWSNGRRFAKGQSSAESVYFDDTEGMWYFYFDGDGVLRATQTFSTDLITKHAIAGMLYWDATNDVSIIVSDERHGRTMDGDTHLYLHNTRGAQFGTGLALTNIDADASGNLATSAQLAVADGTIWDEDIEISIVGGDPQTLSPIAAIPFFYRSGAGGLWRRAAANNYVFYNAGSGRARYNQDIGGTWQLTEAASGNFVLSHIFATNCINNPIIIVMGQQVYTTIANARAGADTEIRNLAFASLQGLVKEFVPIATLIGETSNSYSNAVKTRIRTTTDGYDYVDWRGQHLSAAQGALSASDHGTLSGLGDDDHTQYALADGTRGNFQPLDAQLTDIAGLSPTKGNIIVGNGTNFISLGIGTDTHVLTADAAQASGIKWAASAGGGVSDHGALTGLTDDDHTLYALADGTRGNFQPLDADLSAIAALTGNSGFLKTDGAGVWSVDTNTYSTTSHDHSGTYQPLDGQLTDIAGLTPTKGNIIVGDGTNYVSVGVGTNNQVLVADSAQTAGVKWATASGGGATDLDDLTDVAITSQAKGDILVSNGTNFIDVGVGTNGQVLTADSAEATGVKWATASGGGATFPRSGGDLEIFDDFHSATGDAATTIRYSEKGFAWRNETISGGSYTDANYGSSGMSDTLGDKYNHAGVWQMQTAGANGANNHTYSRILLPLVREMEVLVAMPAGSSTGKKYAIGFSSSSSYPTTDGSTLSMFFCVDTLDAGYPTKWMVITDEGENASAVFAKTDTGVSFALDTWYKLKMTAAYVSEFVRTLTFFINGTQVHQATFTIRNDITDKGKWYSTTNFGLRAYTYNSSSALLWTDYAYLKLNIGTR